MHSLNVTAQCIRLNASTCHYPACLHPAHPVHPVFERATDARVPIKRLHQRRKKLKSSNQSPFGSMGCRESRTVRERTRGHTRKNLLTDKRPDNEFWTDLVWFQFVQSGTWSLNTFTSLLWEPCVVKAVHCVIQNKHHYLKSFFDLSPFSH